MVLKIICLVGKWYILVGRYILNFNFFLWYIVFRVKFLFIKIYDGDDFDKYIRGFIFKERFSGV